PRRHLFPVAGEPDRLGEQPRVVAQPPVPDPAGAGRHRLAHRHGPAPLAQVPGHPGGDEGLAHAGAGAGEEQAGTQEKPPGQARPNPLGGPLLGDRKPRIQALYQANSFRQEKRTAPNSSKEPRSIASGGMTTITSPSGRSSTPRSRASRHTRAPV